MKKLQVYLKEKRAGILEQASNGQLQFVYDADYIAEQGLALSCAMPLTDQVYHNQSFQAFFAGLLPEGNSRLLIAKKLGFSQENDFAFLEALAGECVGAISLQENENAEKQNNQYLSLDEQQLAEIFSELPARPILAGQHDVRLSLAGAQSKIAIKIVGEQLFLPLQNSQSTHILKPAIKGFPGIVENEAFCLLLANAVGIDTVEAEPALAEDKKYLAVKRYDRDIDVDNITRLHQEDFCQALAVPPQFKYQNEGGPSLKNCFDLIKQHATTPAKEVLQLLKLIVFNFVIGNNDAHGKNFSFLYDNNQVRLTPAYDLLSTAVYPNLSDKQAMKIGGI
jgi:serine/threonine-protein kinase HipA